MLYSNKVQNIIDEAIKLATQSNHIRVEPIHIVKALCTNENFTNVLKKYDVISWEALYESLDEDLSKLSQFTPSSHEHTIKRTPIVSVDTQRLITCAQNIGGDKGWYSGQVEMFHLVVTFLLNQERHFMSQIFVTERLTKAILNDVLKIDSNKFKSTPRIEDIVFSEKSIDIKRSMSSFQTNNPSNSLDVGSNSNNSSSSLDVKYCTNLVELAKEDKKPFIGREKEVLLLLETLERMDKPNAILVGEPGVGKTDIVRGLARKISENDLSKKESCLKGAKLIQIDIAGMLAGAKYRGEFEERLKGVLEYVMSLERPILFIDEIHTILGAGASQETSSMDAGNILKPYLTRGEIRLIGATTNNEYRRYIEQDYAFTRRFQKIDVDEPSQGEAIEIIQGIKSAYEEFHNLKISKSAIATAVELSCKHIHDRKLPDKAIDLIDMSCARTKLEGRSQVASKEIEQMISSLYHIPINQISEKDVVRDLGSILKKNVFGQEEAIDTLVKSIQTSKVGLGDPTKPIGSFLFVGSSGVGKTLIAKQLANALNVELIRFDMSEYMEAHSAAKLIGTPPGYVGYEEGGLLIEQVRNNPHSVILFDEIEKAHPSVYKIFLQMLDYGMVQDNKGRKASFRNTIIIMTSNVGNSTADKVNIGFGATSNNTTRKTNFLSSVEELMPPEIRGRIGSTIVFNNITKEIAQMIVKKELDILTKRLKVQGIRPTFTQNVIDHIIDTSLSDQYGAREIQKVINDNITKLFVEHILSNDNLSKCEVDYEDKFIINEIKKEEKKEKKLELCK